MGAAYAVDKAADPGKASVVGAAVSGALGGLAADLAAGGLTFGAGALLGGLLGAAGARGSRAPTTSRAQRREYGSVVGRIPDGPRHGRRAAIPGGRALRSRPGRLHRRRVPRALGTAGGGRRRVTRDAARERVVRCRTRRPCGRGRARLWAPLEAIVSEVLERLYPPGG